MDENNYTILHFALHFRTLSGGKYYGYYTITLCYYYIETIKTNKNINKLPSLYVMEQSVIP